MNFFKSKKGITVAELLIALAVILIVLTLCFQTYFFIYNSYEKNEENWIIQQDVRKISDWIDINIQTAYILEIYLSKPDPFENDDDFYYLYFENGGVYLRKPGEATGELIAGDTIEVKYSFDKDKTPNALDYVITGYDPDDASAKIYEVEGTVLILNIPEGKKINYFNSDDTVSTNGTCIKFKTTVDGINEMLETYK